MTPDTALRIAGFVIVSRPKSGSNRWKRKGRVYQEREAEKLARAEGVQKEPVKQ